MLCFNLRLRVKLVSWNDALFWKAEMLRVALWSLPPWREAGDWIGTDRPTAALLPFQLKPWTITLVVKSCSVLRGAPEPLLSWLKVRTPPCFCLTLSEKLLAPEARARVTLLLCTLLNAAADWTVCFRVNLLLSGGSPENYHQTKWCCFLWMVLALCQFRDQPDVWLHLQESYIDFVAGCLAVGPLVGVCSFPQPFRRSWESSLMSSPLWWMHMD